jgi:hypothetical protein
VPANDEITTARGVSDRVMATDILWRIRERAYQLWSKKDDPKVGTSIIGFRPSTS